MAADELDRIRELMTRVWFGLTPDQAKDVYNVLSKADDEVILADPSLLYAYLGSRVLALRAGTERDQHGPIMASSAAVGMYLKGMESAQSLDDIVGYGSILIVGTRVRGDLEEAERLGEAVNDRIHRLVTGEGNRPAQCRSSRPGQIAMQRGLTQTLMGDFGKAMGSYSLAWSRRGEPPFRHFAGANAAANAAMLAAVEGHYDLAETWLARVAQYEDRDTWSSYLTYLGEYIARGLLAADALDLTAGEVAARAAGEATQAVELWPFVAVSSCAVELAFGDPFRAYEKLRAAAFAHDHDLSRGTAVDGLVLRAYLDCLIAMGEGNRVLQLVEKAGEPPRTLLPMARVHLLSGQNEAAAQVLVQGARRDDVPVRDQREFGLLKALAMMRMNRLDEARESFTAFLRVDDRYCAGIKARVSAEEYAELCELCGQTPPREPTGERAPRRLETVRLTRAELQVLQLLANGSTVTQVAEATFTSANTVKTHVRSIYRKLGVTKRPEALWRADELGLLDPES